MSPRAARPDERTEFLLELLAPIGPVSARRMFGSLGLFHREAMFGLIVREELFLKVGDANRADYEKAGEAPFSYPTKNGTHTLTSYWRCPPELLDDPDELRGWARKAIAVALAKSRAKPKPRRRASR